MKTIINKTSIFFQSIITVCIFSAFGVAQNTISIDVGDGTIDVLYNSDVDIGGFQFTVEGATVTGTSGGDAAANGFTVTCNSTLCLGFSFSGAIIPTGSGTLVIVSADITGDVSLTGIVFSDAAGNALDFTFDSGSEEPDYIVEVSNFAFTPDHLDIAAGETVEWVNLVGFHNVDGSTDTYPDNPESFYNGSASSDLWSYSFTFTVAGNYDYECTPHAPSMAGTITVGSGGCTDDMACNYDADADFDDGSCLNNDCAGVCGGSAEVDECGVCGGDGSDDLGCGCFAAGPSGCDNVCGSTLENDACGVCGGDGSDDLGCGCFAAGPSGCDNVCGSTLENDECGVCGGDGIADGTCDCAGNVDDCAGICGGSTEVDECGICGGPGATGECGCDGIAEGTCNCDGNVLDECGVCGGDGSDDLGCGCFASGPSGCDNMCGSTLENDACGVCGGDGSDDLGCGCFAAGPSGCDNACGSTLENDDCGVCDGGNADMDCAGVCNGTSELDDCGVCDGGNTDMDCAGECGGSAVEDECGVCGGDGSSCASSIIDILYNTTSDIGGFQFNVDGVTILSVSGGAAADAGFFSSYGNNTVLGFSFTGATIPAGSGVLVQVEVDGDTDAACLSAVVLSDAVGGDIDNEVTDCFTISQVEIILGCLDMAACNYNVDATEDDGSCTYADENYDCDGNCTVEVDCFSVCGGGAVVDECGECGGDGIVGHACDCDGNVDDCAGECGGSAVEDDCGVCGGDGTSCIPVQLGFGAVADGIMEITYNSPSDIAGFQFDLSGVIITSASNGAAGENGFMISSNSTTVIAFSLTGSTIPAGSGVLIELTYEATAEQACLESPVISDTNGEGFDIEIGACADVDDCVGEYDCAGDCNGSAVEDDCGVCDGGNADMDCAGECGGSAEVDDCGVCDGGNADMDCAGDCNGSAVEDDCGVCDGGNADMDCAGVCDGDAVEDCAGVCNGTSELDECGVCGGDGIADGACDCAGNIEDCAGECGGAAENCPDWVDCPSCYENTASMTAIVLDALSGDQMYADGDILAAFDDAGNNRGIAILLYPIPFGPYEGTGLYEIQIRGDAAGDAISFKYYDASEDEVLDSGTGYTFVIDDIIGDVVIPHEISVGAITLSIDIASGWNWFSLNVEGDMSIGSVMASLTSTDGDFIKSASASSTYYPDFGWYGGLDELGVIGMYKFNSANADLLVFSGAPVDPLSTPIELASGWNWLGFTPQNDGATADALGTITTNDGDFIKNQGASSTYYSDFGWYGGLEVMAPTEGYMLSVAEGSVLTYPNFGVDDALTREKSDKELPVAISNWEVDYHDYEFNGHITMSIDSRGDSHGDYIAVFVGDECRGLAERMYFPFGDSYMYSVMVYSNLADGEELRFKYYDSAIGEIVEYAETIDFTSDMIVGDGFNTYSLSSEASDMQQPMTYDISDAYPNPFNPVTSFEYTLEKDGMVQVAIYDLNGRMVSELVNGYQSAGSYPVVWDANDLSSGVYLVNMTAGDYSTIQKVMLIK